VQAAADRNQAAGAGPATAARDGLGAFDRSGQGLYGLHSLQLFKCQIASSAAPTPRAVAGPCAFEGARAPLPATHNK